MNFAHLDRVLIHMKHIHVFSILLSASLLSPVLYAAEEMGDNTVSIGSQWELARNGSTGISASHGQVLYFLASDAYQTFRSREFQTWDNFSAVDSRNLIRVKKSDRIELEQVLYQGNIMQVKLLDGFHKNKSYYLIAEELEKNFLKK